METAGPRFDTRTQSLVEVSNSTITSQLPFNICNVSWIELFIWSCSNEASHCIKIQTSLRVTCRSYLSVQLPDTFPQNTCQKQRITFHSWGDLILRCHSSLAPEPGCYDSKAYPHCSKWHWQIIICQRVWQQTCTHTQTHTGLRLSLWGLHSFPNLKLTLTLILV